MDATGPRTGYMAFEIKHAEFLLASISMNSCKGGRISLRGKEMSIARQATFRNDLGSSHNCDKTTHGSYQRAVTPYGQAPIAPPTLLNPPLDTVLHQRRAGPWLHAIRSGTWIAPESSQAGVCVLQAPKQFKLL